MPRVTTPAGVEIHYETVGAGPPLLLISGTGHDHTFWSNQLPALSPHYTCTVFDNRGVGQSSVPPTGYTLADMADDALAVLDATAGDSAGSSTAGGPAHIMGFSMGGHIAQELALAHPDRVRSLGLHHTWTKPCPHLVAFQTARRVMASLDDMRSLAEYSVIGLHAHPYYDEHAADIEAKKRWIIENSGPAAGWLGQLDACIVGDTSERLSAIRVPTLVTASDLDILAHPHHAQEIHQRITGSQLVILPGNGHVSLIEDPDTFAGICLSFLQKQDPDPAAK